MWLLLFFSEAKRELFSLIISHIVNISIAGLTMVLGIKNLLKGELTGGFILLTIGILVGGVTIYLIQKSIRNMIKEKDEKQSKDSFH